ncbi:MAG: hypothetical protein K2G82_01415 [Paramuribaculum sp.]|nr:hypothetical protein [Paramuribaculum sp.]
MRRTIISIVACAALCFAASAQKQWHQELINMASASSNADVNAVVNRDHVSGTVTNARYRIYLQPSAAAEVRRRLAIHQKEAGMYSVDSKKLVMSFDDAGVRTNYSLSLKGRKRLLLISQQKSYRVAEDGTLLIPSTVEAEERFSAIEEQDEVARQHAAEVRRQAAEARKQAVEARKQAAEARKQAAENRRQAVEARKQAAEARRQAAELRRQRPATNGVSVKRSNSAVTMIQNDPTPAQKQEMNNIDNALRKESERRRRELQ